MTWDRYTQFAFEFPEANLSIDLSRTGVTESDFQNLETNFEKAFADMDALEKGAIANPDENRMVGHYWLRDPDKAPSSELSQEIASTMDRIKQFAARVHSGDLSGSKGVFTDVLVIGIGGSALGPQFIARKLEILARTKPVFTLLTIPIQMESISRSMSSATNLDVRFA